MLHMAVIQEIFQLLANGTRVIYITGNHDEVLRRYSDVHLGNFQLTDKIVIEINGKMTWIFHGDVFDHTTIGQARLWTRLGSNGYAGLLMFNSMINRVLKMMGKKKVSLSKTIMRQFNSRMVNVEAFETMVAELAIEKKYDSVICGHIHQPQKKIITTSKGKTTYLNSGDWVEHLTAVEYIDDDWNIYVYDEKTIDAEPLKDKRSAPQVITTEIAIYLHSLDQQPEFV